MRQDDNRAAPRALSEAGTDLAFEKLSAVFSGVADLRKVFEAAGKRREAGRGTLLFIDEIHRFNRAQQDAFLPYVEDGTVILVGATTENPSFELNGALLSRAQVLVLRRLDDAALETLLARAEAHFGHALPLTDDGRAALRAMADGDGRFLLNLVEEIERLPADRALGPQELAELVQRRAPLYDKSQEGHYSTMTNSSSLNGSETSTGGSIIIPMDISDELTTMSITRNGMKMMKPMMKAVFSSERMKAGISAAEAHVLRGCGALAARWRTRTSRARRAGSGSIMKVRSGTHRDLVGLGWSMSPASSGCSASSLIFDRVGPMTNMRQEQREADEHLVGRDALQAQRVAGQRQHDDDAREAGEHDQQRRCDRQQRQQDDDQQALARACRLAAARRGRGRSWPLPCGPPPIDAADVRALDGRARRASTSGRCRLRRAQQARIASSKPMARDDGRQPTRLPRQRTDTMLPFNAGLRCGRRSCAVQDSRTVRSRRVSSIAVHGEKAAAPRRAAAPTATASQRLP